MKMLRFLLNGPIRRRIRTLHAALELLTHRVESLEQLYSGSIFPDAETRQKLSESLNQAIAIHTTGAIIQGILVSVHDDSLEIKDESGQLVMIPAARITTLRFLH